ncbi:MAG: MerR family transcriptional regulator, partial [Anaerovoracaceae bacterium]
AKLNNISQQALRLYDKEGLIHPIYVDETTGYRYYHIIQSARLDVIQYMKTSGMTLRQIQTLLDSGDNSAIKNLLSQQKISIDNEINRLNASRRAIDRTLENYHKYETLPASGNIFMEYIPERYIYSYSTEINFFDQNYTDFEYILRELKQHLTKKKLPMTYFCNVGTILRKDSILKDKYISNEIFLFVDKEDADISTEKIPAGTNICICADGFYEEKESAQKLISYIKENGYQIIGDYICEVLLEFPVFESPRRNMFLKMQIPVIPPKKK